MSPFVLAARRLWRAPGFSVAAVLLLGCGMAVAAASFMFVSGMKDEGLPDDARLVRVALHEYSPFVEESAIEAIIASPPESIGQLSGYAWLRRVAVIAQGASHAAEVEAVYGSYFDLLGGRPVAGRLINAADTTDEADIAVISARFWERGWGSSPDVMGSVVRIAGRELVVVGVVEVPVHSGLAADVWVPSHALPIGRPFRLFGLLGPGRSVEEASAEVSARYGDFETPSGRRLAFVRQGLSAPLRPESYARIAWLVALATVISLTAAGSFGLLLLARLAGTQGQLAVRIALGATTRDLTRLLAAEVVLLATAATVVAILMGQGLVRFVFNQVALSVGIVRPDTALDWRVLLAVGALTMIVAFAVVARLGWRIASVEALGSMVGTGGLGGATIRTADASGRLVVAQAAASTALLLAAALVARSAVVDHTFLYGLDPGGATIAWIDQSGHADVSQEGTSEARRALDVARNLTFAGTVALVSGLPARATSSAGGHEVHLGRMSQEAGGSVLYVSSDAFDAIGLTTHRGRIFTDHEDVGAAPVAVVSRAAARSYWPGMDPIGRRLWFSTAGGHWLAVTVIGEVADGESPAGRLAPRDVYLPFSHRPGGPVALLLRTIDGNGIPAQAFTEALQRGLPDVGLLAVRSLQDELFERTAPPGGMSVVFGALGLLVFGVAVGGLYGLTAHLATIRRREIGIRRALGATTATLYRMLARESYPTLGLGLVLGMVGALFIGAFFVRPGSTFRLLDPVALLSVPPVLLLAGLAAALVPYVPAIRAHVIRLRDQ